MHHDQRQRASSAQCNRVDQGDHGRHGYGRQAGLGRRKIDGVGYAPFYEAESKVPADLVPKLDAAFAEMQAGTLKTCPSKADGDPVDCGQLQ